MQLESDSPKGALFEIQLTGPGGRPISKEGGRTISIEQKSDTYHSDSEEEEHEEVNLEGGRGGGRGRGG